MTLKIFKFNNKISKEQKIYYEHNVFVVFRNLFKKKEVQLLDKSIEYFADEGWHNIMNPDRISFLLAQSHFKFNKLKSQNEKIKFIENAVETSSIFRSYLLDKRIQKSINSLTNQKIAGLMTHVIFKHNKIMLICNFEVTFFSINKLNSF